MTKEIERAKALAEKGYSTVISEGKMYKVKAVRWNGMAVLEPINPENGLPLHLDHRSESDNIWFDIHYSSNYTEQEGKYFKWVIRKPEL